jgi:hypothetical protein
MLFRLRLTAFVCCMAVAVVAAACGGGGGSAFAPQPNPSRHPSPAPSGSPLTAAQVTTKLQNVESTYQNLPHTSVESDLTTLAKQMVSSGAFEAAAVEPGGIVARLSDGKIALVFADRAEDLGGASASSRLPMSSHLHRLLSSLSPPNAHETAFLINTTDTTGAFTPSRQAVFSNAFTQIEAPASGYGVDDLTVSLENIVALGSGHPIDYLDIATHGMIGSDPDNPLATNTFYAWLSTTQVTQTAIDSTYKNDYSAGRIMNAIYLTVSKSTVSINEFAFTPAFVTEQLTFNPGAIVDNQSCWGQNPLIESLVQGTFQSAGVGRYFGWTKEVGGNDADETEAFMFDRMLGEQSPSVTGLDTFIPQNTPPQRPFPLDQIQTAMASENRNTLIQSPKSEPYTVSNNNYAVNALAPPIADGTTAKLVITDFGGESVTNAPIDYGFPSIAQLQVAESPTSGTMTILGSFPATPGTAQITDTTGTYPLTPSDWATDHVTVPLPVDGAGSAGSVQVFSSGGITSNPVPLTQWHGLLRYNETDSLPEMSGQAGSGTGTLALVFNIGFRADVHPTVSQIDTAAQPQNLYFLMPEGDSTAAVTAFNGTFTTNDGMYTATFSVNPSAPIMTAGMPPLTAPAFDIGAIAAQPAPCNNGSPGPQGGAGTVLCPEMGFVSLDAGFCSDDDSGDLCPGSIFSPRFAFGQGGKPGDGLLILTMDPSTYAITVSSNQASGQSGHFGGGNRPSTATMSGTLQPAAFPPTATTPAGLRHRPI